MHTKEVTLLVSRHTCLKLHELLSREWCYHTHGKHRLIYFTGRWLLLHSYEEIVVMIKIVKALECLDLEHSTCLFQFFSSSWYHQCSFKSNASRQWEWSIKHFVLLIFNWKNKHIHKDRTQRKNICKCRREGTKMLSWSCITEPI